MKGFLGHHKREWIREFMEIEEVLIIKGKSEEALIRLSSVIEKTYVTEVPRNDLFY